MASPIDGKQSIQLSGQTVFRCKAPTNKKMATKIPCFAWDYSKGMNLFPDRDPDAFIESQPQKTVTTYTPLNQSGEPLRLKSTTGSVKRPRGKLFLQGQGNSIKALKNPKHKHGVK